MAITLPLLRGCLIDDPSEESQLVTRVNANNAVEYKLSGSGMGVGGSTLGVDEGETNDLMAD